MATKKKIKIANPVDTSVSIKDAKAPIGAMKTTLMGLLKKGWEFDKKIVKSCWDFLKVGDVYSYVVGIMGLWLVYAAVANIF
mgnify:FL=1|jgi:hypothetical protein